MTRTPRSQSTLPIKVEILNQLDALVSRIEEMVGRYLDSIPGSVRKELSDALKEPLELLIRARRR